MDLTPSSKSSSSSSESGGGGGASSPASTAAGSRSTVAGSTSMSQAPTQSIGSTQHSAPSSPASTAAASRDDNSRSTQESRSTRSSSRDHDDSSRSTAGSSPARTVASGATANTNKSTATATSRASSRGGDDDDDHSEGSKTDASSAAAESPSVASSRRSAAESTVASGRTRGDGDDESSAGVSSRRSATQQDNADDRTIATAASGESSRRSRRSTTQEESSPGGATAAESTVAGGEQGEESENEEDENSSSGASPSTRGTRASTRSAATRSTRASSRSQASSVGNRTNNTRSTRPPNNKDDGTPVSSTSTLSSKTTTTLRRSTRERRQTPTIYNNNAGAGGSMSSSEAASRKPRRSTTSRISVDVEMKDKQNKNKKKKQDSDDESMDEDDEKSASSSSDEEEEEEAFTPKPTTRKRKAAATRTRGGAQQAKVVSAQKQPKGNSTRKAPASSAKKKGGGRGPAAAAVSGTATEKAVKGALARFANKILDASETPETSLTAALLASHSSSDSDKSKPTRRRKDGDDKKTMYTPQLEEIARRVILEHHDDSNQAQVDLFNLLIRAVGGGMDALLDPDDVEFGHMTDLEVDELNEAVVAGMHETPVDEILFSADPQGAAHAEGVKATVASTAAPREFRKILQEFWYLLGVAALNTPVPAPNRRRKEGKDADKSNDKDDKDSDDSSMDVDKDDDDDDTTAADISDADNARIQVEMVQEICNHLIEKSVFPIVDLRAATTIAVFGLMVAMLEKTKELDQQIAASNRQLDVAKKHRMKRKAKVLSDQVDNWTTTMESLETYVEEYGQGVFIQRYLDPNPFIRADSIDALRRFTLLRPDKFMCPKFTKYFGYTLSDREAVVRQSAARGLLATFEAAGDEYDKAMTKFAEKFVPRLADMTLDTNSGVEEGSMKILLLFLQKELLDSIEDDGIWNHINLRAIDDAASPALRKDAFLFVVEQLEAFDSHAKRGTEANAVAQIKAIARWIGSVLSEGEIPIDKMKFELTDLVVASMRACPEHLGLATNFSALLRALNTSGEMITEESQDSQRQRREEDVNRRVMLRMLVAAVEMEVLSSPVEDSLMTEIVDGDYLECRHQGISSEMVKKKGKKQKASDSSSSRENLTLALLRALPDLMTSFKTEPAIVRSLTALPQYFLPSLFNLSNQKKNFTAVVRMLLEIFMESTDKEVLENCLLSLTAFAKTDHARSDDALLKLTELVRSLRNRLVQLFEEKAGFEDSPADDEDEDEDDVRSQNAVAISLCLNRLAIIAKRWSIADLIGKDGTDNGEHEVEQLSNSIARVIAKDLNARATPKNNDDDVSVVPEVWKRSGKEESHSFLADTVGAALDFLVATATWAVEDLEESDSTSTDESESTADIQLVRMRERIKKFLLLCFEQFVPEVDRELCSKAHITFSNRVQQYASQATGDLRALFPKPWVSCASPVLRACALSEDNDLVGANVRYLDSVLRIDQEGETNDPEFYHSILLPFSRGLLVNWQLGNRREGVVALSHIASSNSEVARLCESTSKTMMKLDPVRFLEAQLVALRDNYDDWLETIPDETDESPSEQELDDFEKAEKAHGEKFKEIEHQAERLSAMLALGRRREKKLGTHISGFIKAGIDLAFEGEFGARLSFLTIISKYLKLIAKDKQKCEYFKEYLNAKERMLRQTDEFDEVFENDLEALDNFRKIGKFDVFPIDDDSTIGGDTTLGAVTDDGGSDDDETRASTGRRGRLSMASSVSSMHSRMSQLSPVLEEDASTVDQDEDGESHGISKRQKLSADDGGLSQMAIKEAANEEESDSDATDDE